MWRDFQLNKSYVTKRHALRMCIAIAASASIQGYADSDAALRFDGIYQSQLEQSADNQYRYFFRFYSDGTVIGTPVVDPKVTPKLQKWFAKENEQLAVGHYVVSGAHIEFTTKSVNAETKYFGEVNGLEMALDAVGVTKKNYRSSLRLEFISWDQ